MKKLRRIIAVIMPVMLVVIMLLPTAALAAEGRLHDGAGLLGDEQAVQLAAKLDDASDSAGLWVGVVTVSDIGTQDVESFADEYYHANGMGAGEARDGVVAFVAMESRDIYIYTYGPRAIALLDDARIESILDDITDKLSQQQYAQAFTLFVQDVESFHAAGIKEDQYTYNTETGRTEQQYREPVTAPLIDPMWALASLGIAVAVAGVSCAAVVGRYKLIFVPDSYPFREKGCLELTRRQDIFLRKHVTSRVIPQNNGGAGGSRSSVGGSVGGGSHGGGGRKF